MKKENTITIKLTGNNLVYLWLQGIKRKLEAVLAETNSKKTAKDLKEIIKLLK